MDWLRKIPENDHSGEVWNPFRQELQTFARQLRGLTGQPRDVIRI